jgi:hypothetical protein
MPQLDAATIAVIRQTIVSQATAGVASATVKDHTVTAIPLKDLLDALDRLTPMPTSPGRAMGFVKTIPPGAG